MLFFFHILIFFSFFRNDNNYAIGLEVSVKVGCNAGPSLRLRENLPAIIEIDARSPERLKSGWRRRDRLLSTAAENGSKTSIHLYSMNVKKRYLECVTERSLSHGHENPDLKEKKKGEKKEQKSVKVEYSKSRLRPLFSIKIPNHAPSFLRRDPWERKRRNIYFSLSFFCFSAVFTLVFFFLTSV